MLRRFCLAISLAALLGFNPTVVAQTNANAQTRVSMDKVLPAIDFTGVTLADAIDFLRDVSGANIHVNWRALEAAGIGRDTTINVKLRQVSLRKVLSLILSEASGGTGVTFYADEGVIEVTTSEIADSVMYTIVYDVRDLLVEPMNIVAPPTGGLGGFGTSGGSSGGRSGGSYDSGFGGNTGGGIFGGQSGAAGGGTATGAVGPAARAQELIDLIILTVQPNTWQQNGGNSTIRFFSGNLIVTAPRSVQEAIGGAFD